MTIIRYLKTATVNFETEGRKQKYASISEARAAAERHVGNRAATKPFPNEEYYLYGPGNGDTTVSVRQDLDMDAFMGRTK